MEDVMKSKHFFKSTMLLSLMLVCNTLLAEASGSFHRTYSLINKGSGYQQLEGCRDGYICVHETVSKQCYYLYTLYQWKVETTDGPNGPRYPVDHIQLNERYKNFFNEWVSNKKDCNKTGNCDDQYQLYSTGSTGCKVCLQTNIDHRGGRIYEGNEICR